MHNSVHTCETPSQWFLMAPRRRCERGHYEGFCSFNSSLPRGFFLIKPPESNETWIMRWSWKFVFPFASFSELSYSLEQQRILKETSVCLSWWTVSWSSTKAPYPRKSTHDELWSIDNPLSKKHTEHFYLLSDSMQFIHREHVYVSSRRGAGKFWLEATHIVM